MDGKVQIDCETLQYAIEQMKTAYSEFIDITENGFRTEIEALDAMNSDFIDKFSRVLEIAKDWNLDSINENIGVYIEEAQRIYEEIRNADETLAQTE